MRSTGGTLAAMTIRKAACGSTIVGEDDEVEVVNFVGGG